MSDNPYKTSGTEIPEMLGRRGLFERLCRHLTKATPDHISVVGPKRYGKSVLLKHLATHFSQQNDHFLSAMFVDLRHGTPETDSEFRSTLALSLRDALAPLRSELADLLDLSDSESINESLPYILDELERSGERLLVVLDGFDHLPLGTGISPNMLDQMRSYAQRRSLWLVTGSRSRLRELCKTEASRTSDFWRIFHDPPLQIGCFEPDDWDGLLEPLSIRGITIDQAGRSELHNWSGGVPILAAALLQSVFEETNEEANVSKPEIDQLATSAVEARRDLLDDLWEECNEQTRSDLVAISAGELAKSQIAPEHQRDYEARGFVTEKKGQLIISCRLLDHVLRSQGGGVHDLRRLFGTADRYGRNIARLLEMRFDHIPVIDMQLKNHVQRALNELRTDPEHCFWSARGIVESALRKVWELEHPRGGPLPQEWHDSWQQWNLEIPADLSPLPEERGPRCKLLRLITGRGDGPCVAKYVSRMTSTLVDQLQQFGNFMNHRGSEDVVTRTFAAAMCLTAVELCQSLVDDVSSTQ